jgi:hypothetical protein
MAYLDPVGQICLSVTNRHFQQALYGKETNIAARKYPFDMDFDDKKYKIDGYPIYLNTSFSVCGQYHHN